MPDRVIGGQGPPGDSVYAPIPSFPGYWAGADGSVWSFQKGGPGQERRLKPVLQHRYLCVDLFLTQERKHSNRRIHRLILEAFVGPCPDGMECCHCNGVPTDNRLENLRWDTHKANGQDAAAHGTMAHGSKHPFAKLVEDDVIAIRRLRLRGMPVRELTKWFPVSKSSIRNILHGKKWRHLSA
jgi:hypothetical protein